MAQVSRILLAFALVGLVPAVSHAEWQIKPYLGLSLGADTTIVDPALAVGERHVVVYGVSSIWQGNVFGVEADLGHLPGFFETDESNGLEEPLVTSSRVTTLAGNLVIALPRRWAGYSLRPYLAGGGGMMAVHYDTFLFSYDRKLPMFDVGGGVTGYLTRRVGVSWDLRYFKSFNGPDDRGASIGGAEQLSFWRAMMGMAIRVGSTR